jgi:hypothetical protein
MERPEFYTKSKGLTVNEREKLSKTALSVKEEIDKSAHDELTERGGAHLHDHFIATFKTTFSSPCHKIFMMRAVEAEYALEGWDVKLEDSQNAHEEKVSFEMCIYASFEPIE